MSKKTRKVEVINPTEEDQIRKKKALEVWNRARMELLTWRPFLGVLAMQLEIIPVADDRCRTASTDGRRIFCSAEFILGLSDDDSLFILAHEVLHCALMHFSRQKDRIENHMMWNYAIDHEVNSVLQADGLVVPKGAVLYHRHLNMNAEQIYEELESGRLPMIGELMDDHDLEKKEPEPQQCQEGSCGGDGESGDADDGPITMKVDPDYHPMRSDAVWREWAAKTMSAASSGKSQGDRSAALQRVLDRLAASKLDWRTILKQWTTPFIGGNRTWLPPNRRHVHKGLYLPSRRGCKIEMVAVIDTSGSVWEHGVYDFLSELQAILASFGEYEITVLQVDTHVNDVQVFDFSNPFVASKFQIRGGGGTSFAPAFQYVKENKNNNIRGLIYMTDGYGFVQPDAPPYPVLWALTEDGRKPIEWGQVVTLEHKNKANA